MNSIDKLIAIFSTFPGIGPRQARRFVYYLLTRNSDIVEELSKSISSLKKEVISCADCKRFFEKRHGRAELCDICSNMSRDRSLLMIVQRDIDLESVEKNGGFNGIYFVLGGSVPILEKEPQKRIRSHELKTMVEKKREELKEIILAMNFNPEGENTADYVRKLIEQTLRDIRLSSVEAQAQGTQHQNLKISMLGKGLSTGTELEYTDPETLKNALKNRG